MRISSLELDWFSSYLGGHIQEVRAKVAFSNWSNLEAGVPQGGILSHLLFYFFISHLYCNFYLQICAQSKLYDKLIILIGRVSLASESTLANVRVLWVVHMPCLG